ncbi:MAG: response regulator [Thermodesulfobacteriota bacterium]
MDIIQGPTIRLWIAEDDEEFRQILGKSLAQSSREISIFPDGQAVLRALAKTSFDILVTDLVMPGVDGLQLLGEVKRLNTDSLVIIMTGYASIDTAIKAIRGGAYDYIRKPFKIEELEVVLNHACEKIRLKRENRQLFCRLQAAMKELKQLKDSLFKETSYSSRLPSVLDYKLSELDLILKQMVSSPADIPTEKKEERIIKDLKKFIEWRKEGLIDQGEFRIIKKMLLNL